jgi:uncharacterized protein (TIGR00730 family)
MSEHNALKAYEDLEFLKRDELRSVRLQCELLKPHLEMNDYQIHSTVVVFGSARIPCPETARQRLEAILAKQAAEPRNDSLPAAVRQAEMALFNSRYYALAREFAAQISVLGQARPNAGGRRDFVVTTGGGPGIMEAANRGAHDVGAKSVGLNITLPHEQQPNPYISPELNFTFHYFSIRKMHFLLRARALCAFPGGFGTMDELFETLTLIQTHKTKAIPVIMFGREFWDRVINWQIFIERGMISEGDLNLFHFVETVDEAITIIKQAYADELTLFQ